jgi:8-amino-7-oxononanoate synthase
MKSIATADRLRPIVSNDARGCSPTAWTPNHELDAREWVAAGRRIGTIGRCIQWLLGDWIAYGNLKFGERYARASQITGYDPQTLMNMVYVASRFAASRRREALSWSHHETLAALERAEQEQWLDKAVAHRWSVSDLRMMLRTSRKRLLVRVDEREAKSDQERSESSKVAHDTSSANAQGDAFAPVLRQASKMSQPVPPAILRRTRSDPRVLEYRLARQATALPYFRPMTGQLGAVVQVEGRERVMLGSNNYLGLASHPRVIDAAREALHRYGTGSTGSRLLNGTLDLHIELEATLAEWLGAGDALAFTTGYQANIGMLTGLLCASDVVVCDSADHASILDGASISGARLMPFRHGRLDRLERLLQRQAPIHEGLLVVVDSVFSMGGDVADLPRIASICRDFGAALAVDEAHAVGVLGTHGQGAASELGVAAETHLRVGTFSKSLASSGGFVAGDADVIDMLRVKARSFLFTTASVPAALGAALAAIGICRSAEGAELIGRLRENVDYLRKGLGAIGLPTVEPTRVEGRDVASAIVPVVIGDGYYAALLWKALYDRDIYTSVALYPATARNRALIRLSVMAIHTREHLDRALEAFADIAARSEEMREQAAVLDDLVGHAARGEPAELAG